MAAAQEICVVSITDDGRQLAAHGYKHMDSVRRHIADRLAHKGTTTYSMFVVISTLNDGHATTTCHHLSPLAARRFTEGR